MNFNYRELICVNICILVKAVTQSNMTKGNDTRHEKKARF